MEHDLDKLKEILDFISKKSATIIWISCINKKRNLSEMTRLWGIDERSKYLYKVNLEKMQELGIISFEIGKSDTGKGKRLSKTCHSKMDWLVSYFHQLVKEYKQIKIIDGIKKILPFTSYQEKDMIKVFESKIFRKGCMNLEFLIEEISKFKAVRDVSKFIGDECFSDKARENYIKNLVGETQSIESRLLKKSKNLNLSKMEDARELYMSSKSKPWEHDFTWQSIISGRIKILSLIKTFEDDKKCFEKWNSGYRHFSVVDIPLSSYMSIEKIYKFVKDKKYDIPENVKPLFTTKDIANEEISRLKSIKDMNPDIWREIEKGMNLKEL